MQGTRTNQRKITSVCVSGISRSHKQHFFLLPISCPESTVLVLKPSEKLPLKLKIKNWPSNWQFSILLYTPLFVAAFLCFINALLHLLFITVLWLCHLFDFLIIDGSSTSRYRTRQWQLKFLYHLFLLYYYRWSFFLHCSFRLFIFDRGWWLGRIFCLGLGSSIGFVSNRACIICRRRIRHLIRLFGRWRGCFWRSWFRRGDTIIWLLSIFCWQWQMLQMLGRWTNPRLVLDWSWRTTSNTTTTNPQTSTFFQAKWQSIQQEMGFLCQQQHQIEHQDAHWSCNL